ncbi:MAG: AfsR/SARP family transcriptional regulator, partial [Trebonia sp.]
MTVTAGHRQPAASSPPDAGGVVRIRLLGRFAVDRDEQEIALRDFGGRLARRLLRLLTVHRGTLVPKDLITEALWPDCAPADAPGNIEVLVSRLRRAVGDRALIRTGPGGYVLADGGRCWVDAEAFLAEVRAGRSTLAACPAEALASFRTALDVWRGEPLPEDIYAEWAQADRRHLSMSHLEALDGAATAALESAGAAAAAEAACWAGQALAAEPLRESSAVLLVRAIAAGGDRAGALAAFDEYRGRLAAETGLEPTPLAHEIRQRILAGRAGPMAGPVARPARPAGSPPDHGEPLLGRERECAAIADLAAGHGRRVALVTGPSGIGKSA